MIISNFLKNKAAPIVRNRFWSSSKLIANRDLSGRIQYSMNASSTLKKCTLFLIFVILLNSTAHADIVWPSVYIAAGMASIPVILAGLVVEILFVKYFTKIKWLKATAVAFLMNLVSSLIGVFTNEFSGLLLELILYYVFGYDSPTFNWDHWMLHYTTIIFINTLIEGGIVRLTLKLKLTNTFLWLFLANTISVMLCAIYIHFVPIRL